MIEKLLKIQQELKVPKNRRNTFGNYNYRSCEDIVDAAKPLCHSEGFTLVLTDDVVEVGGRVYVKATAMLTCKEGNVQATGWAREAETKKGMDEAQITGSASSYARKYALNGLFAIDDVADADATNTHDKEKSVTPVADNNNFSI
jgi:ERF superfamily